MEIVKKFDKLKRVISKANELFTDISKDIDEMKKGNIDKFDELSSEFPFLQIDKKFIKPFFKKPYALIPRRGRLDEWYLIVPRFVNLALGYLERQTESHNIFIVNRYIDWLYKLPPEIKDQVGIKSPDIHPVIENSWLIVEPEKREFVWEKYRKHFVRREDRNKIRIKTFRSHKFDLVCELIKDGIMPFKTEPIVSEDLTDKFKCDIVLRDYQEDAWKRFMECGHIGIFWAGGGGKGFFGTFALSKIKVDNLPNLVVTPTKTLVEDWQKKLETHTDISPDEYPEIICYASIKKVVNKKWGLVVMDEVHHLPAPTYSQLALLKSKYTIGLSASPYREDGKSELIFALTGFPIGIAWEKLFEKKVIIKPSVHLYTVSSIPAKFEMLDNLLKRPEGKCIIYCDSIYYGKRIGNKYNIPFVYSQTKNRLDTIEENPIVVCSRVADEGIDITTLKRVIEFDFLFGSRRQELQRVGRLLHSEFKGKHYIIMTGEEYERHKKRLYSIMEKGIKIQVHGVV